MPEMNQYIIVRSRDQGCVAGEYRGHAGREVTLANARQIWAWNGNDRISLIDVAVVPGNCRLSRITDEVVMLEACGMISVTPAVEKYLRTAKADKE